MSRKTTSSFLELRRSRLETEHRADPDHWHVWADNCLCRAWAFTCLWVDLLSILHFGFCLLESKSQTHFLIQKVSYGPGQENPTQNLGVPGLWHSALSWQKAKSLGSRIGKRLWRHWCKCRIFYLVSRTTKLCSQEDMFIFNIIRKHAELLVFVVFKDTNPNVLISYLCISASGFLLSQSAMENICHSFSSAPILWSSKLWIIFF